MRALLFIIGCNWLVNINGQVEKPAVSSFPSLSVHPGSREMGMGDNGMAIAEGTGSLLYNPAISAFTHYQHQLSVSYMPWLTGISQDARMMRVGYLNAVTETSSLGFNLSYLDLGQIDLRDDNGATLASYRARDYHAELSYALQFASKHSISISMKLLGQNQFGTRSVNRYSFCGDIGYYGFLPLGSDRQKLHFGSALSNLGPGINLPAMAAAGIGYTQVNASGNQVSFGFDISRLLKEDWSGIRLSTGIEYGFAETFFIRGGLSLESNQKGDRRFFSLGTGYKGFVSDQSWGVDLHYLVPFGSSAFISPFQNVYGISLLINIGNYE